VRQLVALLALLTAASIAIAGDGGVRSAAGSCHRAGCSQEVCTDQTDVLTACVYSAQAKCLEKATCGRGKDGGCAFALTPAIKKCLAEADRQGDLHELQ